ncbi:tail sheath protein [Aeromonas phage Gekk3-15]
MISFKRYINIVSGVGAGQGVRNRELILRVITNNTKLQPGIVAEFSTADAVGSYFGANSEEYKRALKYFAFISKSTKSPKKISFGRWVASDIAPMIVGDANTKSVTPWQAITAGTLSLSVKGTTVSISAINTSAATNLTNVASLLQTQIRTNSNVDLATATVQFDTNTQQFTFTGGVTGIGSITAIAGGAADVSGLLGWTTTGAVNVPGQLAATPAEAIKASAAISTNFGSFLFNPVLATSQPSDVVTIKDVGEWNHAQNNRYMFLIPSSVADAGAIYTAAKGLSGMGVTITPSNVAFDHSDQCAAEILAATDYNVVNGTQNYMYYQFDNRSIAVTDDTVADQCDAIRANYVGVTETGGQQIAFYQRGVLFGPATAALDMNVYANEMWLKDDIGASMMSLMLNSPQVPANEDGRASLLSVLQNSIGKAKTNGVISAGKTLDNIKKQYITQVTGSDTAWRQVQDSGSYFDLQFREETNQNGTTEWVADYLLIYSKNDSIRKVNGTNTMI